MPARKTLEQKVAEATATTEPPVDLSQEAKSILETGDVTHSEDDFLSETPEDSAIPPAPEMDPAHGDKTPAFVEWLREYHPEKFKARYVDRNRKTHITEKVSE